MSPKSVPVPMIRRVRLKNFRSIAECDVELGPLTLLVGPNGSGKSNFLSALHFVSEALNNGLESAVNRDGGIRSLISRWALDDSEPALEIGIDLDLSDGRSGQYAIRIMASGSGGYRLLREQCTVRVKRDRVKLAEFIVEPSESSWVDVRGTQFLPPLKPFLGERTLTLPHVSEHQSFGLVYRALRGVTTYSLHVSGMRAPHVPDSGERLSGNGDNIASVLRRMREKTSYGTVPADRVLDWIATISPGFKDIVAREVAGFVTLQFEQQPVADEASWTFDAHEVSYGTLRTLGVLVALYQGQMRDVSPVTLIGIEEPESAVHPGSATAILEAMDEASMTTQIVATTHSAAMLDYEDIDPTILRAVARRAGRTMIGPIDAASRQILEESLYSAGELLDMGHLVPTGVEEGPSTHQSAVLPA